MQGPGDLGLVRLVGVSGRSWALWWISPGPETAVGSGAPSQPAGGWGCVPAQPAAWPEVSHYWCRQAGGRGRVPALIS